MAAAVIQLTAASGTITNCIVADADRDSAPPGSILVNIPDGISVGHGWSWDSVNGFISPPPAVPVGSAAPPTVSVSTLSSG